MASDPTKTEPMLREGLEFDSTDLTYNRGAVMTEGQRARLMAQARGLKRLTFLAWLLCIALPAGMVVQFGMPFGILAAILLALGLGWLGLFLWQSFQAVQTDLHEGMVIRAAGPVRLEIRRYGLFARNYIHVEGESFAVSDKALLAFKNNERYYIHYAPRCKLLLSGEPVSKAFKGSR